MVHSGDIVWIERSIALPFRAEPIHGVPTALRELIDCGPDAKALLWRLDWQQLSAADRSWIESGEELPAITHAWLDRAAALLRLGRLEQMSTAVLEVHTRCLTAVSIGDLSRIVGTNAWFADANVALVWGFPHEALAQPQSGMPLMHPRAARWPLRCRGAVYASGDDGLDVGWWALPQDLASISAS